MALIVNNASKNYWFEVTVAGITSSGVLPAADSSSARSNRSLSSGFVLSLRSETLYSVIDVFSPDHRNPRGHRPKSQSSHSRPNTGTSRSRIADTESTGIPTRDQIRRYEQFSASIYLYIFALNKRPQTFHWLGHYNY